MIQAKSKRKNGEYMVFNPKRYDTKNGDMWRFTIADRQFNKETKKYEVSGWVDCIIFKNGLDLNHKDMIVINKIIGINTGKFTKSTGEEVKTMSAVLEIDEYVPGEEGQEEIQEGDFMSTNESELELPF